MSVSQLIQGPVLDGLREQQAISDVAFNERIDALAGATGYNRGDIVATFNEVVESTRRQADEAELITAAKSYTVSASINDLFNRGAAMAEKYSSDDNKVGFSLTIEKGADGVLRFVPSLSGRKCSASSTSGSNIDGFTAYERGSKKGDTFTIERVGKGEFRDVTRNEDVPQRGLIKWILTHYADSQAAAILNEAGKSL